MPGSSSSGGRADKKLADAVRRLRANDAGLTELDLEDNDIGDAGAAALAEALRGNTELRKLNLGGNNIGAAGAAALAEVLRGNTGLRKLVLWNNGIGAAGAAALAEALRGNTGLRELSLSNNGIGAAGAAALAEALRGNNGLRELSLDDNDIGDEGAAALAEALRGNTGLTVLDLHSNGIGTAGAAALAEALSGNTGLTELYLGHNGIGAAGAAALAEALRGNTGLRKLELGENGIGAAGAVALAEALRRNTGLTVVHLRNNGLGDAGAAALAEALRGNTGLRVVDLWGNGIGAAGAAALAEALRGNTGLRKLNLFHNRIGDAGAAALAEALRGNTGLTELDLDGNGIGDAGAAALAEALRGNTGLTELHLYGNGIGDAGAVALAEALRGNTGLRKLYLTENNIRDAGAAALAEALRGNTGLTELRLDDNCISDAVRDELKAALAANQARRDAERDADERRAAAVRQQLAEMGFAEGADADDGLLRACDYDVARVIDRLVGGGAGAAGGAPPAPPPAAAAAAGAEGEVGMLQQALEERDDLISDLQGQKSDLETKLLQLQEGAKLLACERAQVDEALEVAGRERDRAVRELERLKVQLAAADERAARSERRLERQWVVHEDDVTLCQELGRGSFGTVHLARWQGSNIAVKTVAPHASPAEKAKAAKLLVNEARALKRVRHANIILMLGACAEPPMLLMQLAPGGRTLRRELDEESPSVARRFHLIRGVCAGMAALHSHGVLHLDIKPTNVLIGGDGAPLLADFGLSIQLSTTLSSVATSTPAGGGRGTFQYRAPELFSPDGVKYDSNAKPADVYSFAMLVWETVTGIVPWTGADMLTLEQITWAHIKASEGHPAKRLTLPSGDACPPAIGKLISVCWAQDPAKRPTFDAALAQLDSVASDFPTDDAGRLAGKAAAVVDDLERRLKAAEAERADLEHLAAHGRAEMDEASRAVDALKAERDAAVRDRDALAGALRAATVTFPETWTEQADDGGDRSDIGWWRLGRQLVNVDARTNGDEWERAAKRLREFLPTARLVQLERWENRLLWRDYWTKREHLRVKRGDANEQWLWHGTGRTPPATVLEHEIGPDPRFSKGGFYGPGLYLAEKARYSNDDRYVYQVPAGTLGRHRSYRQLLLCLAALGKSFDFGDIVHKDLKKPPEESAGVLYDSVRGGPHQPRTAGAGDNDSPIFVLYDLAQAYPEYVVTYELE